MGVLTFTEFKRWLSTRSGKAASYDAKVLLVFAKFSSAIEVFEGEGEYPVLYLTPSFTDETGQSPEPIEWSETDSFRWFSPPYSWLSILLLNNRDALWSALNEQ